ncbi:MBL fold metallo-hydrolase [Candidatus Njordibacter sp. Uisw_056]|uniref:MBL fold metallo-hydrolase n=1 Tax=Candidatus Njordibacter sp. Uisw_056 TaxID=3230973 RepID=UPI003D424595
MTQSKPMITAFFDEATFTITYIIADPDTKKCAVIDTVLDYDANMGRTRTDSADKVISSIKQQGLTIAWLIETHVHADHLSAAPYIQKQLGGTIAISDQITHIQDMFGDLFDVENSFARNGSQFDHLLTPNEELKIGNLTMTALHTPGHTPACMSFVIGDACFVGDTLFMPDYGTARCDFPGGDATTLYESMEQILSLPDETRLFMCHDYAPGGREYRWETTVAESKASNIHLVGKTKEEFIDMRKARDAKLSAPRLLLPSVQVNMRAGHMPPTEDNGIAYIKIPVNQMGT